MTLYGKPSDEPTAEEIEAYERELVRADVIRELREGARSRLLAMNPDTPLGHPGMLDQIISAILGGPPA